MPHPAAVRVLVAVRDPIASMGLRAVLGDADGVTCLPVPDGLGTLREAVAADPPDVLVLDVALRRADADLIPDLVRAHAETRILVYVDHAPEDCAIQHMLESGGRAGLSPEAVKRLDDCCLTSLRQQAHGCLGTGVDPDMVVRAVRGVAAGAVVAAPWLAALARTLARAAEPSGGPSPISERELEIMTLLAEGLSNRQIAERLGVREQTVKNHVTRTMEKLGAQNRTEVGLFAARSRLRLVEVGAATAGAEAE